MHTAGGEGPETPPCLFSQAFLCEGRDCKGAQCGADFSIDSAGGVSKAPTPAPTNAVALNVLASCAKRLAGTAASLRLALSAGNAIPHVFNSSRVGAVIERRGGVQAPPRPSPVAAAVAAEAAAAAVGGAAKLDVREWGLRGLGTDFDGKDDMLRVSGATCGTGMRNTGGRGGGSVSTKHGSSNRKRVLFVFVSITHRAPPLFPTS